jgi:HprK-related kinase A
VRLATTGTALTLAESALSNVIRALERTGLWIDVGAVSIHVDSDCREFAVQLQTAYGAFPFVDQADWADIHVQIRRGKRLRRWIRPQVILRCDGQQPFEPFPSDSALPLFEWGCNWLIGHRVNDLLLLHAGVVEKDGLALLLPALPGSGKSTLAAALSWRGWRLLSDEFGAFEPESETFRAMLKPVALKNESIQVIRRFAPQAIFGPEFPKTRKGAVAHLAAQHETVKLRHSGAKPGAVILPKWEARSSTRLERVADHILFPTLAFNAFNYNLLGAIGFKAVVRLVRRCPAWQLVYSDLDEAVAAVETAWADMLKTHTGLELI